LLGALGMGLFVLLVGALLYYQRATVTTVLIVRHAEKEPGGGENPPLSAEGERRAERLATLLGRGGSVWSPVAIYVSATERSKQTAAPLARLLGVTPIVADADPGVIVSLIQAEHHGEIVLVVGHSNTVPAIVAKLSGRHDVPKIDDDDYGNLYVVAIPSLGKASVMQLDY